MSATMTVVNGLGYTNQRGEEKCIASVINHKRS